MQENIQKQMQTRNKILNTVFSKKDRLIRYLIFTMWHANARKKHLLVVKFRKRFYGKLFYRWVTYKDKSKALQQVREQSELIDASGEEFEFILEAERSRTAELERRLDVATSMLVEARCWVGLPNPKELPPYERMAQAIVEVRRSLATQRSARLDHVDLTMTLCLYRTQNIKYALIRWRLLFSQKTPRLRGMRMRLHKHHSNG